MAYVSNRNKGVGHSALNCFPRNTFASFCVTYDVRGLSAPTAKNGQDPSSLLSYRNPFVTATTVWCLQQPTSCPTSSQVVLFIFVLGNNPNWEWRSKRRRCPAFIKNSVSLLHSSEHFLDSDSMHIHEGLCCCAFQDDGDFYSSETSFFL